MKQKLVIIHISRGQMKTRERVGLRVLKSLSLATQGVLLQAKRIKCLVTRLGGRLGDRACFDFSICLERAATS
jgi:hypothetical protein